MRLPKTRSFFTVAIACVAALSAGAKPNVGPSSAGPRPNGVRPYVAREAAVPAVGGIQQEPITQGLSPARAGVAASLPRHGGVPIGSGQVPPPLRHAALNDGNAVAAVSDRRAAVGTPPLQMAERRSAKPFTQEQVVSMVRDGFGDESGAKLIEQRGIDFAPSEDFLQTLKAAGASEAFLKALRAAVAPGLSLANAALKGGSTTAGPPASAKKPINQVQVFALLVGQVPSHRVAMLVHERASSAVMLSNVRGFSSCRTPARAGRLSPCRVCAGRFSTSASCSLR